MSPQVQAMKRRARMQSTLASSGVLPMYINQGLFQVEALAITAVLDTGPQGYSVRHALVLIAITTTRTCGKKAVSFQNA